MNSIKENSKTKFDVDHLNMMFNIVAFALSDNNISVTQSLPAFYNSILTLRDSVQATQQLGSQTSSPLTGITQQKLAIKENLITFSINILNSVYSYSITTNNEVLKAIVKTSPTRLRKMKYSNLVASVQGAINTINPLISSLGDYGITPQNITDWQTLCTAFKATLSNTRNSIANRVTLNISKRKLMVQSMSLIYNQLDKLAFRFRSSNPSYYNEYLANRKLNPHHLSTQLRATVKDENGNPVPNADIYILGTDRTATTDSNGYGLINAIPFGYHEVTVTTASATHNFGRFRFKKGQSLTQHFVITAPVSSPKAKTTHSVKEE